MPAVDIINLKNNEQDKSRDFSLAFAGGSYLSLPLCSAPPCLASGDLRNVVRTVNALGSDYTGRVHILLSDISKATVSRNIILLTILGAMPNEPVAADIALHFWYSVFLPEEYRLRILASLVSILQQHTDKTEPLSISLGSRAKLTCLVPREITDQLLYTAGPTLSTSQTRDEYERVNAAPARLDARNRALVGVKPCHSLAFMAFWRSGVVLPFSIDSDHHTAPNGSFFSPCGTCFPNSFENPFASWEYVAKFSTFAPTLICITAPMKSSRQGKHMGHNPRTSMAVCTFSFPTNCENLQNGFENWTSRSMCSARLRIHSLKISRGANTRDMA